MATSRTKQQLEDARRDLDLYTQNVIILQNALQKKAKEQSELFSSLQEKLKQIDAPLLKAQQRFAASQREFERAQASFTQAQQEMRSAQDEESSKKQQATKQVESKKSQIEREIEKIEKDIGLTQIKARNAERDVSVYARQLESEERNQGANDNRSNGSSGFSSRNQLRR